MIVIYSNMTSEQVDPVNQESNSSAGDINFGLILFSDYFDIELAYGIY